MSMEINNSYNDYRTNYSEWLKAEQEKANEAEKGQGAEKASNKIPVLQDEYIRGEESGVRHSGLYRLGQDENGNPKVSFDEAKKCTTNTDKVDREIEKLKEQKKQLEQQIKTASGDEKKVRELEKKLAQIKSELSQKNNDTYRRQNASVSE